MKISNKQKNSHIYLRDRIWQKIESLVASSYQGEENTTYLGTLDLWGEKVGCHMVGKDVFQQLCIIMPQLSHVLKFLLCLEFP